MQHVSRLYVKMNKELESTLIEARARIIWGSSLDEVAEWLESKGLDREKIARVVRICREERAAEIRKIGLRNVIIGGLILLPSLVATLIFLLGFRQTRPAAFFGVCVVYGLWRLLEGLERLIFGAGVRGSVAEMDRE